MLNFDMRCSLRRSALLAGCILFAAPALAQDGTGASVADGDMHDDGAIVVTALKRSTTVQETPLAITAVTGETLADANVTDVFQLNRVAPGLRISEGGNGGARITLRNINASGEPVVGLYYDDTPLISPVGVNNSAGSANPDVRLFDVERIEVLRGPQGTLYGSASMAGTVRLIYAKPDLNEYEGAAQLMGTTVDGGGLGGEVYGMVNAPIVSDVLGVRVVGFYRERDGWIDNSWRDLKNINDYESYGGRVMLRFQPTDDLTIDGMAYIQRYSGFVNNFLWGQDNEVVSPAYDAAWLSLHENADDLDLFTLSGEYDFGFATLSGTVSHQKRYLDYTSDSSNFFIAQQSNASRCATYIGVESCDADQLEDYRTFALSQSPSAAYSQQTTEADTQEIRLSSNGDGRLDWTVGLFHSKRDGDIYSNVVLVDEQTGRVIKPLSTEPRMANGEVVAPASVIFRRQILDTLEQTAAYGEGSFEVIDGLNLTAGARWYKFDREVTGEAMIGNIIIGAVQGEADTAEAGDKGWVFKFGADYQVNPDLMIYASASEGFRPGGVNQVIGLPAELGPYASDSLWSYEIGVKSQLFDRMLTLNFDVYQIDWSDIQVSGQADAQSTGSTFSFISNAGAARVRGVEVEANLNPLPGLNIRGNLTYADAKLVEDQVTDVFSASGKAGDPITGVPEWTWQLGAEYVKPLSDTMDGLVRLDAAHTGGIWTSFDYDNPYRYYLPAYTELSGRIGVEQIEGDWGAYLFVNNMLNEMALTSKGSGTLFGSGAVRGMGLTPRTIGIELRKRF
ncbi:TonB-dependent receptor [Croceicoccus sp. Ery5]|uniref:TonB-dependent receptor n=1 Tax=Croceicoccus sp. Ery5 TaxID=1703340 RepID=UPI001E39DF21|nr:TonB-dependent receptor [Croceicoccus sp. Ery5]